MLVLVFGMAIYFTIIVLTISITKIKLMKKVVFTFNKVGAKSLSLPSLIGLRPKY